MDRLRDWRWNWTGTGLGLVLGLAPGSALELGVGLGLAAGLRWGVTTYKSVNYMKCYPRVEGVAFCVNN